MDAIQYRTVLPYRAGWSSGVHQMEDGGRGHSLHSHLFIQGLVSILDYHKLGIEHGPLSLGSPGGRSYTHTCKTIVKPTQKSPFSFSSLASRALAFASLRQNTLYTTYVLCVSLRSIQAFDRTSGQAGQILPERAVAEKGIWMIKVSDASCASWSDCTERFHVKKGWH